MCWLQVQPSISLTLPSNFLSLPTRQNVFIAPQQQRPKKLIARAILSSEFPPNALRRETEPQWRGGFSLGVDLGLSYTGVARSKGFSTRPLTVWSGFEIKGRKAGAASPRDSSKRGEEADEFVIGIPKSIDGKETIQSNKVRSVAGRLAVRAAQRGWRVYLQDEHGTSTEATSLMIDMGVSKSNRQKKSDAYAAMLLLERYFSTSGQETEIIIPKNTDLLENLRRGARALKDDDFYLYDD